MKQFNSVKTWTKIFFFLTFELDFGISPKNINATERSSEIGALIEMIEKTKTSLNISLTDFYPFDTHFDSIWNELENGKNY